MTYYSSFSEKRESSISTCLFGAPDDAAEAYNWYERDDVDPDADVPIEVTPFAKI